MDKQQILNDYDKMRENISISKDNYLESMFKYIKAYFSMDKSLWSWETFYPALEMMIFESLTKTYSITAAAAKAIYGIEFNEMPDRDTLEKLTYSKDGKTLEERMEIHFEAAIKRDNPSLYYYNRLVLVMDTETLYASNHVIHGKLKKYATHVEVIGSPECSDEDEGLCEYYVSKGKIPIEELDELPPYHPDCECEVIYYIDEEKI